MVVRDSIPNQNAPLQPLKTAIRRDPLGEFGNDADQGKRERIFYVQFNDYFHPEAPPAEKALGMKMFEEDFWPEYVKNFPVEEDRETKDVNLAALSAAAPSNTQIFHMMINGEGQIIAKYVTDYLPGGSIIEGYCDKHRLWSRSRDEKTNEALRNGGAGHPYVPYEILVEHAIRLDKESGKDGPRYWEMASSGRSVMDESEKKRIVTGRLKHHLVNHDFYSPLLNGVGTVREVFHAAVRIEDPATILALLSPEPSTLKTTFLEGYRRYHYDYYRDAEDEAGIESPEFELMMRDIDKMMDCQKCFFAEPARVEESLQRHNSVSGS